MKLPYITVTEPTTSNHERVQEILQKIYSYRGQQANSISYNGISLLLQELNEYVTVVACGTIYYEDTCLLIMLYGEPTKFTLNMSLFINLSFNDRLV